MSILPAKSGPLVLVACIVPAMLPFYFVNSKAVAYMMQGVVFVTLAFGPFSAIALALIVRRTDRSALLFWTLIAINGLVPLAVVSLLILSAMGLL